MRYLPEFLDRSAQEQILAGFARGRCTGPAVYPGDAPDGQAVLGAHDQYGAPGLGFRQGRLPLSGQPSGNGNRRGPPFPESILAVWNRVSNYPHPPEACLVNFYGGDAKMGLHQDRDEEDFAAPVVSISLGDTALFRIGGTTRGGKTQSLKLASGDVLILEGPSRLAFHGIDRVIGGSSTLLKDGGRINLTLRRVTKPLQSP